MESRSEVTTEAMMSPTWLRAQVKVRARMRVR
jgi:hypothetical protein